MCVWVVVAVESREVLIVSVWRVEGGVVDLPVWGVEERGIVWVSFTHDIA